MLRDASIQHIYRWYSDLPEDQNDGSCLVQLCWGCAVNRGESVQHAETPDQSEELTCDDCEARNEQAVTWEREMLQYLACDIHGTIAAQGIDTGLCPGCEKLIARGYSQLHWED